MGTILQIGSATFGCSCGSLRLSAVGGRGLADGVAFRVGGLF